MKTLFSLPKDDGFFNRYATLIPTLRKIGILSQVINAVTEFGVVYAIIFSLLSEFWGTNAVPLALAGAFIGTGIIELGLRKFLPYSARAILFRRFAGLDLWMTAFILATTLALFGCSLFLSFKGSKAMVEAAAPTPVLQSTTLADSLANANKSETLQIFRQDSAEISSRFAALFSAQKAAHSAKLQQIAVKEKRTHQKYDTERSNADADNAAKVAALTTAKAGEMAAASTRKTNNLERITADHNTTRQEVNATNKQTTLKAETRTKAYGSGLAWFTLIFHFVLILAVTLDEMHKKGSGIEQVAQPTQYDFSAGIGSEFVNTLSEKWNYHARTWIRKWAERTPAPPKPVNPHVLYELADWMPHRVTLSGAKPNETAPNGDSFTGSFNGTNDNGKHNGTYTKSKADRSPVVAIISSSDPFPRARNNGLSYAEEPGKVVTVDASLKPCAFCGELFRPKTTWQKFCKTDCKLADHEKRHGQPFDPIKAKFKRKATV